MLAHTSADVILSERSESRDPFDSAFGLAQDKRVEIQQIPTQPMDPSARSRCSLGRDDRVVPHLARGMTSVDWRAMNLWSAGGAADI